MSIISKAQKKEASGELVLAQQSEGRARTLGPALGVAPRANLMPPELGENRRKRAVRRGLRVVLVLVVVIGVLGIAGARYLGSAVQSQLSAANAESASLSAQTSKFAGLKATEATIADIKAAQRVGGGQDIDWSDYLRNLQATLPAGVTLTQVSVKAADPTTPFAQSTVPLERPRIAELTFTADSATLPRINEWIDGLSSLRGFADATPGSVNLDGGTYSATVIMHINSKAYSRAFTPKGASK